MQKNLKINTSPFYTKIFKIVCIEVNLFQEVLLENITVAYFINMSDFNIVFCNEVIMQDRYLDYRYITTIKFSLGERLNFNHKISSMFSNDNCTLLKYLFKYFPIYLFRRDKFISMKTFCMNIILNQLSTFWNLPSAICQRHLYLANLFCTV